MIRFDEDFVPGGKQISGVIVAMGGVVVGIMAAIMGVGGGFITFPMFVYIFGVSSMTTVGTDILQIIFTAGLAAVGQYAIYGYVFYTLAMGMLIGSLLGIQVGALTTKVVKGIHIRGFYAVSILAGFINRAGHPAQETHRTRGVRHLQVGGRRDRVRRQHRLLGSGRGFWHMGLRQVLRQSGQTERGGIAMLIRHKKMFNLGVLLAISFLGVLLLIFSPIFGGVNGLDYADNLFNKLSKGSSYFIPKLMKSDEKYLGAQFSAAIKLDKPEQVEKSLKILTVAGAQVSATGADLTISGDLGNLLRNVLKDADAMYNNNGSEVATRYGFDAKEVLTLWWNILSKMDKTFKKEKKIEESKAVSEVVKKAD